MASKKDIIVDPNLENYMMKRKDERKDGQYRGRKGEQQVIKMWEK